MRFSKCLFVPLYGLLFCSCEDKQQQSLVALSGRGYSLSVSEFLRGAKEGDGALVELFLKSGLAVDVLDSQGHSALETAAAAGNFETIDVLLKANARAEPVNRVLTAAVRSGKMRVLRRILEQGVTPDAAEPFVLLQAVKLKQREMVETLLPMCAREVDQALLISAQLGDVGIADMLLHAGSSLLYADPKSGRTALMEAAEKGGGEIVDFLIRSGACRFAADNAGNTALDLGLEKVSQKKESSKLLTSEPTEMEKTITSIWAHEDVAPALNSFAAGLPEVVTSTTQVLAEGHTSSFKSDVKRLHGQIISGDALLPVSLDDPTSYLSLSGCHLAMLPCLLESESESANEAIITFLDHPGNLTIKLGEAIPGTSWTVAEFRSAPLGERQKNYPSWWWPNLTIKQSKSGRMAILLPHLPTRVGELCAIIERTGDKTRYETVVGDVFSTAIVSSSAQHEYVVESISSQKVVVRSRNKEGKLWIVTPNTGR